MSYVANTQSISAQFSSLTRWAPFIHQLQEKIVIHDQKHFFNKLYEKCIRCSHLIAKCYIMSGHVKNRWTLQNEQCRYPWHPPNGTEKKNIATFILKFETLRKIWIIQSQSILNVIPKNSSPTKSHDRYFSQCIAFETLFFYLIECKITKKKAVL
jgi:hypothetical protein